MGSKVSSAPTNNFPQHDDPAYRKCQDLKMERWIQLHYQIKAREKALEIARKRELCYWLLGFYGCSVWSCALYYKRTRRVGVFMPLGPMGFIVGYYTDWAYGSKLHRIQAEANMILENEHELAEFPGGITVASIDAARVEMEMEIKLHPHHT